MGESQSLTPESFSTHILLVRLLIPKSLIPKYVGATFKQVAQKKWTDFVMTAKWLEHEQTTFSMIQIRQIRGS